MSIEPYYDKDGITIYHADCRDVLPQLPRVDLVLTDPPYGIGEARNNNASRSCIAQSKDYGVSGWDDSPPDEWTLKTVIAAGDHAILWGGNFFGLPASSCWLVWDKDNGATDFADCELAWTNFAKAVRKITWRWQGMLQEHGGDRKEKRYHPTQKPLAVMQWCIEQSPDDVETILDPFMGSGTTLVAAKKLGRKAIGIELEKRYCEIAVERLRQGVLSF